MSSLANNIHKWFLASLPLHLLAFMLVMFGNNLVTADIGLLVLLYSLTLGATLPMYQLANKRNLSKLFSSLFISMVVLNFLSSISLGYQNVLAPLKLMPFLLVLERTRPLLLFIMALSAFPVIIQHITTDKKPLKKQYNTLITYQYIIVLGLVIIAFLFRYYNMDYLPSYRDEDHHIKAVWQLLNEHCHDYKRGLLVTYTGAFFAKLTGAVSYAEYLHTGRLGSVIMGSLVCVPLYFLARKINILTAIIACLLWCFSPWSIGVSQNFREHIYYVFLICLMSLFLVNIFEWLVNYKKENLQKIILSAAIILLILTYAVFIDWFSTLKISGVILSVLTICYFIFSLSENAHRLKTYRKYLPFIALLAILFFIPITQIKFFTYVGTSDIRWANTFFFPTTPTPVLWWTKANVDLYLVYFLISLASTFTLLQNKKYFWIYLNTFFILLLGYAYFFDRFYAPRYIVFIYPFFVLIIAQSFSGLIQYLNNTANKKTALIGSSLALVLSVLIINPANSWRTIIKPRVLENKGNANTGIVHYDKQLAINFIESLPSEERLNTTILTTIYGESLQHEVDSLGWIEKYNYKAPYRARDARRLMESTQSGYLIIDKLRNRTWGQNYIIKPNRSVKIGNSLLTKLEDEYVFQQANRRLVEKQEAPLKYVKENNLCEVFKWETRSSLDKGTNTDSTLLDTQLHIDISKPFTLSFLLRTTDTINTTLLSLGKFKKNGISIKPSIDKQAIRIYYGSNFEEDYMEIPIKLNSWNQIDLYQFGGTRGSTYGVIVNGDKHYKAKVPTHKNGKVNVYTNKVFSGDVVGIEIQRNIDKIRLKHKF